MSDPASTKSLPHYTIYVPNPTATITQALATAARAKRHSMGSRPTTGKNMGSTNISQFLAKLWRLVNDEETDEYISWSEDGHSFTVRDQSKFSRDLLPKYFKHHNFSSFVRQLNMYGFRKVLNTERGGLRCVRDDWQFSNKNFSRDRPELLELVRRKPSQGNPISHGSSKADYNMPAQLQKVLEEVNNIKDDNEDLKYSFQKLKTENKYLYNQVEDLNIKNNNQGVIISKIIKFLWSLVSRQNVLGFKRKRQMITHDATNGLTMDEGEQQMSQQQGGSPVPPWATPPTNNDQGTGSPGNMNEQVTKQQNNLHSIQNLLQSTNFPFDPAFVNDLFEYSTEYVTPNLSPCPSPTPTEPPTSPGPSGANFAVQVEQYNDDNLSPHDIHMTSPTYIQHPLSPQHSVSPQHSGASSIRVSPAHSCSPHISPRPSPHISPRPSPQGPSPHITPVSSPHRVSLSPVPHLSPVHLSPGHNQSNIQHHLQQQGYRTVYSPTPQQIPVSSPHIVPYLGPPSPQQRELQQSPRTSPHGSPHNQRCVTPLQHDNVPSGAQPSGAPNFQQVQQPQFPVNIKLSPQHYESAIKQPTQHYEQTEHVVKRDKLSSYEQYLNPVWDEEEEEEEAKIDPSSFFRGN